MDILSVDGIVEKRMRWTVAGPQYVRVYSVYFDNGYDEAAMLYNTHSDLPHAFDEHPGDPNCTVQNIEADLAPNSDHVTGTAHYTVIYSPIVSTGLTADPTGWPMRLVGGGSDRTKSGDHDAEGAAFTNSAKELLTNLPDMPIQGAKFVMSYYEDTNPLERAKNYSNTVSSGEIWGQAVSTARLGVISFQPVVIFNSKFWDVSYPVEICPSGWRFRPLDYGYNQRIDGELVPMMSFGDSRPGLLDGTGKELPGGGTPVVYPNTDPDHGGKDGYALYLEADWTPLNFGDPFGVNPF
jgi:hypothetical protein